MGKRGGESKRGEKGVRVRCGAVLNEEKGGNKWRERRKREGDYEEGKRDGINAIRYN